MSIALLSLGILLIVFLQQDIIFNSLKSEIEFTSLEHNGKEITQNVSAQTNSNNITTDVVNMINIMDSTAQIQNTSDNTNAIKIVSTFRVKASWYKHGHTTANREKFNPNKCTVAHRTLPFNTQLRITNPINNKYVITRINDRGPYIKGRHLDVTVACAQMLNMVKIGVTELIVDIIIL